MVVAKTPKPQPKSPVQPSSEQKTELAAAPPTTPPPVEQEPEKPAVAVNNPPKKPKTEILSERAGAELFKLGAVQAPAYTFSGVSSSAKDPKLGRGLGATRAPDNTATGRDLFRTGMTQYVQRHYAEAANMLEGAVQAEPKAADSNFYLGVCKLMLDRPADAIRPLRMALAAGQTQYSQPAHFYLAKALLQTGKLDEAESEFREAAVMPGRLSSEALTLHDRLHAVRSGNFDSEKK